MTDITNCAKCKKEFSVAEIKCPNCNSWRSDIRKDRLATHLSFFGLLATYFLFGFGKAKAWWPPESGLARTLGETFSVDTFTTSLSGIVVIVLFVLTFSNFVKYYRVVAKKTGNWVWAITS